jgi:hypothetical protein
VTVADLIELLHMMPLTAVITVAVPEEIPELGEFREVAPDSVAYVHGRVLLKLDEF